MASDFDFLKWLRRSPRDAPKEPDPPKPSWLIVKVGDFRVECSKASTQVIKPVCAVMMCSVRRSLPYLLCILGGIGTASFSSELLEQSPTPTVPDVEVCPQK